MFIALPLNRIRTINYFYGGKNEKRKKFKLRPFVSFFMTFSFIHLIITSIVLYIVPPGRFANWTNWKLLGISKGGWQALHTIMGFVFIIFAVIHLILNWKVFINFIRSRVKKALNRTWELAASLALVILITTGSIYNWIPFSAVMNLGENLSNSWEQSSLSANNSQAAAQKTSLQISTGSEAESKAETANESTADGHGVSTGQGMGRKDLKTVIEENNIDIQTAVNRLKAQGIEVSPDDTMKDIAVKYDMAFSEIIDIMSKQ